MSDNRREFLRKSGLLGLTGLAGALIGKNNIRQLENFSTPLTPAPLYSLPTLPYAYDALEPFIDKQTMEIHHSKHHQAYIDKLNKALETYKGDTALESIFKTISKTDVAIRNNGGGHYNHSLFWQLLQPNSKNEANFAIGTLAEVINKTFNSFDGFKNQFSEKALKQFGSGWCWLIVDGNKNLKIVSTANQDNPLMDAVSENGFPLLALDVWEHAYYLKYQNKRADYINNWWNVVNWKKAEALYAAADH